MELSNFFKKNNSKNTPKNGSDFEKKNNKFLKVFGCLALATFMGVTALFAVAPFGTSAANAATNTNLSNTTHTTSPLGLDPENDPVVYTTASGLEIKYANALSISYMSLWGYAYLTLGTYNNLDVNWVLIGYHSSLSDLISTGSFDKTQGTLHLKETVGDRSWIDATEFESAAGKAMVTDNFFLSSYAKTSAIIDDELPYRTVLCMSEKPMGTSSQNALQSTMNTLYESCFVNVTHITNALIKKQNLGSGEVSFFPLSTTSVSGAKFCIENYLPSVSTRIIPDGGHTWWLRSNSYIVNSAGDTGNFAISSGSSYYVRPFFVLQL